MTFLTRKNISRRALLRGAGVAIGLPFLDAMQPAVASAAPARKVRLLCIEMVHGSAGASDIGTKLNLWSPAETGKSFDLTPSSLRSLEPFRDALTIVSNTDCSNAEPETATEIGGDHFRTSAVFLTQSHPKQTEGQDVEAGTSLDQLYAKRFGQDTPIPSMQHCIEDVDAAGGCSYGYSCVYTDCISWASPSQPLPMIRDPRSVFDEMFGITAAGSGGTAKDRSILDWVLSSAARFQQKLGAGDRARFNDYLEQIREVERRLQAVEAWNLDNRNRQPGVRRTRPSGVPRTFAEHVKLMFDLQAIAFASDITRVVSFKLGRDNSNRTYPESGFNGAFHPTSHHSGKESKILDFAKLNTFHVGLLPHLLHQLRNTPDVDGTLLDNTLVLYGSAMGDSNQHNHKRVPFFMVGRAGGRLKGGLHLKAKSGTPLANVMLSTLHTLGLENVKQFGDSDGTFDLNTVVS
jgi:hypothetical protein